MLRKFTNIKTSFLFILMPCGEHEQDGRPDFQTNLLTALVGKGFAARMPTMGAAQRDGTLARRRHFRTNVGLDEDISK
jgi:hypothetical protein